MGKIEEGQNGCTLRVGADPGVRSHGMSVGEVCVLDGGRGLWQVGATRGGHFVMARGRWHRTRDVRQPRGLLSVRGGDQGCGGLASALAAFVLALTVAPACRPKVL